MAEAGRAGDNVCILACSGRSNVGQIANDVVRRLDQRGIGWMYCAVGVCAQVPPVVEKAAQASRRVAIDGCGALCLKSGMEKAGLTADIHVIVEDLGIRKSYEADHTPEQVEQVAEAVARLIQTAP